MGQAYKPHRGRSRARKVLKIVLIVLAVIVIGAIAAMLYLQQFMTYGSDGGARLDLPAAAPEASATDPDLTLPPIVTISPQPMQSQTPTGAKVYVLEELTVEAIEALAQQGVNAVVIEMKTEKGALYYASGLSLAPKRTETGVELAATLRALEAEGISAGALVSCFQDQALIHEMPSLALKTERGAIWKDEVGNAWLDPSSNQVQAYLMGVVEELAFLGFDEIILNHCSFPAAGDEGEIAYDEEMDALDVVIGMFLRELRTHISDSPVLLSVFTDGQTVKEGESPGTGHTCLDLLTYADRLYIKMEDEEMGRAGLEQALAQQAEELHQAIKADFYLVSVVEGEEEGDYSYLQWSK